jgi:hypothetical protein
VNFSRMCFFCLLLAELEKKMKLEKKDVFNRNLLSGWSFFIILVQAKKEIFLPSHCKPLEALLCLHEINFQKTIEPFDDNL